MWATVVPGKRYNLSDINIIVAVVKNPSGADPHFSPWENLSGVDAHAHFLQDLISNHVSPGVGCLSSVKANPFNDSLRGAASPPISGKLTAVKLSGTMHGDYKVQRLMGYKAEAERLGMNFSAFAFYMDRQKKSMSVA